MSALTPPTDTFHPIFLNENLYTSYWDLSEGIWVLRIDPGEIWKNDIFSTRFLPVVYLTPDCDWWDPQATHYADAEAAMINNCGGNNFFVERVNQHAKKKSVLKTKSSSHKNYKITTTQQRENTHCWENHKPSVATNNQ